ncbi:MAG: hypothetical protein D6693_04500 [Planctomycetota bacterium]|nr:MAG: hypothetical protein D6693_04500 [Planctomycetota bacterium]
MLPASTLLAVVTPAGAGVLWDEAPDGDLADLINAGTSASVPPDFGNWTDLGAPTVGVHTVLGSANERAVAGGGFLIDGDAVAFTILPGLELAGLTMEHNQSLGIREFFSLNTAGAGIDTVFVARGFPINQIFNTGLNTPATSDLLTLAGGRLGPGTYVLSWENALRFSNETVMTYSLNLTVVPAPGGALLPALGMIGLIRWRRRA